ncbi:MAG: fructose-6-phosphate aldolase [Bacillota bacterium]|nr:fructose-6-phosphate aldolase [Negativicutes bacterium]
MRFFLDTANIAELMAAEKLGIMAGVTTNPSLIAAEGRNIKEVIQEICQITAGPVSAEVIAADAEGMIEEARELAAIAANVVVKIPMTAEGLQAVHVLAEESIQSNVTLVFSANQALLAAQAGAAYVSPFAGRLDDIGYDGIALVRQIVDIFELHGILTEVIAASIRHPLHVTQAAEAGAHIATVPYKVLRQMINHPLTTSGIEKFMADWAKANKT